MSLAKRSVYSLVTNRLLRPLGRPMLSATQYALSIHHLEVVSFDQTTERIKKNEFIREIITRFHRQTMGVDEAYMLDSAVRATEKLSGDLAEVGVFRGQSARVMCEAKGAKALHLFDTFEGLPPPDAIDTKFQEGEYASSLESVQTLLSGQTNIHFYPGLFPDSASEATDLKFSFVHLDVDLHESTRSALEFFYPRMVQAGIIISHDYVIAEGVKKAFDDFFSDKPECVIELTGNQCMVVKL